MEKVVTSTVTLTLKVKHVDTGADISEVVKNFVAGEILEDESHATDEMVAAQGYMVISVD